METRFDFSDLFVLDLANNHQGSIDHGLEVIRQHAAAVKKQGVRAAIKFQFRELDSFVHPGHKKNSDNKHIPRFLATRLDRDAYQQLLDEVEKQGLLTMCTPFDEASAELIADMGFDIIKVASCSAKDWPLLEAVAETGLPVIISTGGLLIEDVDNIVSFSEHRALDLALMHCVSIYPTPEEACNLQNIAMLRKRFPGIEIGWSTHEDQDATAPIQLAMAYGARIFERHIGVTTDEITLNAYSSTPKQIDRWLQAFQQAQRLAGSYERRPALPVEASALTGLQRGVFAKQAIKAGQALSRDDVYFAMPASEGQIDSGSFLQDAVAGKSLGTNEPLMSDRITLPEPSEAQQLKRHVHEVKAMLNIAGIKLGREFYVEYSHHYGIPKFSDVGCVLIDCVNREYCKKLLVQLPGQSHPYHFHKLKEETFQVLWGEIFLDIDGEERLLQPGDTVVVLPGAWHKFRSVTGCVVEEISTTHFNDDSIYKDPSINRLKRKQRKTVVKHWGRFELV